MAATAVKGDQARIAREAIARLVDDHSIDPELVAAELDRYRRAVPLQRLMEVWDLSLTGTAEIFGVSRQAITKWRAVGVPADRTTAVADLAAATDGLLRYVKRDRIPAVVRRQAPGLGNRSLLAIAESGDTAAVAGAVRAMFAFEHANA